jgi:hypothetical protein
MCIYAEFNYAECHYAECHYAECPGAAKGTQQGRLTKATF